MIKAADADHAHTNACYTEIPRTHTHTSSTCPVSYVYCGALDTSSASVTTETFDYQCQNHGNATFTVTMKTAKCKNCGATEVYNMSGMCPCLSTTYLTSSGYKDLNYANPTNTYHYVSKYACGLEERDYYKCGYCNGRGYFLNKDGYRCPGTVSYYYGKSSNAYNADTVEQYKCDMCAFVFQFYCRDYEGTAGWSYDKTIKSSLNFDNWHAPTQAEIQAYHDGTLTYFAHYTEYDDDTYSISNYPIINSSVSMYNASLYLYEDYYLETYSGVAYAPQGILCRACKSICGRNPETYLSAIYLPLKGDGMTPVSDKDYYSVSCSYGFPTNADGTGGSFRSTYGYIDTSSGWFLEGGFVTSPAGSPSCNKVITSLVPQEYSQEFEIGELPNAICTATFMDGHQELVECEYQTK